MSNDSLILTFDQGTTRSKVALFTLTGENIDQVTTRNEEFSNSHGRWQSAVSWWQGATSACRKLLHNNSVNPAQVVICSVTGRAGAGVFVDANDNVICQPWLDQRHATQLNQLLKDFNELPLYAATLLAKIQWIRDNDIAVYNKLRFAMYAKDYLVYKLTGNSITDPSSGPDALNWPEEVLRSLDIDQELLPQPMLPWDIAGSLTHSAAHSLGLSEGLPVTVGAHDGICANTGAGVIEAGEFALTLGTHGVTRTVLQNEPPVEANRFYCYPPDKHVIGANALMAGRSLDWFLDQTPDQLQNRSVLFKEMDAFVEKAAPGAAGISFFPYLSGQISPRLNRSRKATFHNDASTSSRFSRYQAVLEGASFAIAESFDQVTKWTSPPSIISVTGSGANSLVWVQLLANILDSDLQVTDAASEGRGAAVFAALAMGEYDSLDQAIKQMVKVSKVVSPDPLKTGIYRELFIKWQQLNEQVAKQEP